MRRVGIEPPVVFELYLALGTGLLPILAGISHVLDNLVVLGGRKSLAVDRIRQAAALNVPPEIKLAVNDVHLEGQNFLEIVQFFPRRSQFAQGHLSALVTVQIRRAGNAVLGLECLESLLCRGRTYTA